MRVLHIVNAYLDTPLYKQLFSELGKVGIEQWIHIPVRKRTEKQYDQLEIQDNYSFSKVVKYPLSRLMFFSKLRRIYNDIRKLEPTLNYEMIHAHSLFSDGAVAHRIFKESNVPYLVAIRFTDILFLRFLFIFRTLGRKIIRSAEAVIILSPSYREKLINYFQPHEREIIAKKIELIPNGIDQFWLENQTLEREISRNNINVLYVGDISYRKNVLASIKAVEVLKERGENVNYKIVGKNIGTRGYSQRKVESVCYAKEFIDILERETDKNKLKEHYRKADIFIMPSLGETFGLAYIEAMSQGVPVIYSKKQGIDGYFKDGKAGYAVDPNNPDDIADKIQLVQKNYSEISKFCTEIAKNFNWKEIAKKYYSLYNSIILPNDAPTSSGCPSAK